MMASETDSPVDRFFHYLRVEKCLSANTISGYRTDIAQFSDFLKRRNQVLLTAQRQDVREFLQELFAGLVDGRSVARKLSALRHLYRYLLREKKIDFDPTGNIASPRQWKVLPKSLARDEIEMILAAPAGALSAKKGRDSGVALRDRAVLEVLYAGGPRVSELVDATLEDLKLEARYMLVHGKGDKERLVPLGKPAQEALRQYLACGRTTLARGSSPFLFIGRGGSRLTRQRVWQIVRQAASGLGKRVSPHMLRHSCATGMIENGADLRTVQTILGHADISTTQLYTHLDMKHLRGQWALHPRAQAGKGDKNYRLKTGTQLSLFSEQHPPGYSICSQCTNPAEPGKTSCALHLNRANEAAKRSKERKRNQTAPIRQTGQDRSVG